MTEEINRSVFDAYHKECKRLATRIEEKLPEAGNGTFNGRHWCKQHNIPESVFAYTVNHFMDNVEYGVSPMYPWKEPRHGN